MSVYWKFCKACLERSNVNASYIDDEGSEIPIENECEFEEAVKFAKKCGDNQLHLLLKAKDAKNTEHILTERDKSEVRFMLKNMDTEALMNQVSQCPFKSTALPPTWFTDYMKKFKRKLLEEVKCSIQETIKPVLSEIKKLKSNKEAEKIGFRAQLSNQEKDFSTLGEGVKVSKSEHQSFVQDSMRKSNQFNLQSNGKKLSVKDSSNMSKEQRDHKLLRKIEILSLSKLQNLDSKHLYDEKKKKSEKKSHSKSKLENKNADSNQKLKQGYIHMPEFETVVRPCESFTLVLSVSNYGQVAWENPSLKCSAPKGLTVEEIKLPPVNSQKSELVVVKGKASKKVGVYPIQFELRDADFLLSALAHAVVVATDDREPRETWNVKAGKSKETSEEAVKDIEKRLDGISLQHSSSSPPKASSPALGEKKCKGKGVDAFVNLEESFSKKDAKTSGKNEESQFYVQSSANSCLDSSSKDEKDTKIEKGTEALSEGESEIVDLINLDSSSGSELSILCISEREDEEEMSSENFVFLPLQPKVKDKVEVKDQSTEMSPPPPCEEEPIFSSNLKKPLFSVNLKSDAKILRKEKEIRKLERKNKKFFSRSKSPLPDDRKSSRTKKLKSFKSSEYQFKAADLTRPSLSIHVPYSNTNSNEKTFTFTGERKWEEHKTPSPSSVKENKVPTIDSLGRTIYAVSSRGYCLPVENLMQDDKEKSNGNSNNNNKSSSPNILPDALMNGASNMASLAINTAKSVISNLQSALAKEGTEVGKPACEPKKVKLPSMEALHKLFEMGFTDLQFNRNLLLQHDNDLSKVIEELVLLEQSRNRK